MATTDTGYLNPNRQLNLGRTEPRRAGSDHLQYIYILKCQLCSRNYGANGSDIARRNCPFCQKGAPGLPLLPEEEQLEAP